VSGVRTSIVWIALAAATYASAYYYFTRPSNVDEQNYSAPIPLTPGRHLIGPFRLRYPGAHLVTITMDGWHGELAQGCLLAARKELKPACKQIDGLILNWTLLEGGRDVGEGNLIGRDPRCVSYANTYYCGQTMVDIPNAGDQMLEFQLFADERFLADRRPHVKVIDYPPHAAMRRDNADPRISAALATAVMAGLAFILRSAIRSVRH
jgi:hypothetical protein